MKSLYILQTNDNVFFVNKSNQKIAEDLKKYLDENKHLLEQNYFYLSSHQLNNRINRGITRPIPFVKAYYKVNARVFFNKEIEELPIRKSNGERLKPYVIDMYVNKLINKKLKNIDNNNIDTSKLTKIF
jgi:hypothetical protein